MSSSHFTDNGDFILNILAYSFVLFSENAGWDNCLGHKMDVLSKLEAIQF